jgi:hypothetical protein
MLLPVRHQATEKPSDCNRTLYRPDPARPPLEVVAPHARALALDWVGPSYTKIGRRVVYRLVDVEQFEASGFHQTLQGDK